MAQYHSSRFATSYGGRKNPRAIGDKLSGFTRGVGGALIGASAKGGAEAIPGVAANPGDVPIDPTMVDQSFIDPQSGLIDAEMAAASPLYRDTRNWAARITQPNIADQMNASIAGQKYMMPLERQNKVMTEGALTPTMMDRFNQEAATKARYGNQEKILDQHLAVAEKRGIPYSETNNRIIDESLTDPTVKLELANTINGIEAANYQQELARSTRPDRMATGQLGVARSRGLAEGDLARVPADVRGAQYESELSPTVLDSKINAMNRGVLGQGDKMFDIRSGKILGYNPPRVAYDLNAIGNTGESMNHTPTSGGVVAQPPDPGPGYEWDLLPNGRRIKVPKKNLGNGTTY